MVVLEFVKSDQIMNVPFNTITIIEDGFAEQNDMITLSDDTYQFCTVALFNSGDHATEAEQEEEIAELEKEPDRNNLKEYPKRDRKRGKSVMIFY